MELRKMETIERHISETVKIKKHIRSRITEGLNHTDEK